MFKEHFGDGADTETDMVDSWDRLDELGVKITESSPKLVYFDVPDLLSLSPTFFNRGSLPLLAPSRCSQ